MSHILVLYAAVWLACLAVTVIVETVRLYGVNTPPRWVRSIGLVCVVGLTAPVLIITLPFWITRFRSVRSSLLR